MSDVARVLSTSDCKGVAEVSREVLLGLAAALVIGCANQHPAETVRIDASSPQAAEASYQAMMDALPPGEQQQLAIAVVMLNMEGVKSAYEVVGNPDLQKPSMAHIRDNVAGMTAEEIIERAKENPSVRIKVKGQ